MNREIILNICENYCNVAMILSSHWKINFEFSHTCFSDNVILSNYPSTS